MCILTVIYKKVPGFPVIIASNRDEYYDRQGTEPKLWNQGAGFVAPVDPSADGTWLGCNSYGMPLALTNRRAEEYNFALRSRGLLAAELLATASPEKAHRLLELS